MNKIKPEIGYVVLSSVLDRDTYIDKCERTQTVDVLTTTGTYYRGCSILGSISNYKDRGEYKQPFFPSDIEDRGSAVLLIFVSGSSKPVVAGTISDSDININLDNEGQQKKIVQNDNCIMNILEDSDEGIYTINIFGKNEGKSNIKIKASSLNKDSSIALISDNVVSVKSPNIEMQSLEELNIKIKNKEEQEKYTEISYKLGEGLNITDEFSNSIKLIEEGGVIKVGKIKIGDDDETLKDILSDLIDAILNIQLLHPQSPTYKNGVINKTDFSSIQKRIKNFMDIS